MTDPNYPAGVTNADPHFHDPGRTGDEDAPCADCGHRLDNHNDDGLCLHIYCQLAHRTFHCPCEEYIPYDEDDKYGY